jgi:hypothetical protein
MPSPRDPVTYSVASRGPVVIALRSFELAASGTAVRPLQDPLESAMGRAC